MRIESILVVLFMVALEAAFVILLAKKLGIIEWMQVHGSEFISKMASCDFCLSFWVGSAICLCVALYEGNAIWILGGTVSCSMTRMLV